MHWTAIQSKSRMPFGWLLIKLITAKLNPAQLISNKLYFTLKIKAIKLVLYKKEKSWF